MLRNIIVVCCIISTCFLSGVGLAASGAPETIHVFAAHKENIIIKSRLFNVYHYWLYKPDLTSGFIDITLFQATKLTKGVKDKDKNRDGHMQNMWLYHVTYKKNNEYFLYQNSNKAVLGATDLKNLILKLNRLSSVIYHNSKNINVITPQKIDLKLNKRDRVKISLYPKIFFEKKPNRVFTSPAEVVAQIHTNLMPEIKFSISNDWNELITLKRVQISINIISLIKQVEKEIGKARKRKEELLNMYADIERVSDKALYSLENARIPYRQIISKSESLSYRRNAVNQSIPTSPSMFALKKLLAIFDGEVDIAVEEINTLVDKAKNIEEESGRAIASAKEKLEKAKGIQTFEKKARDLLISAQAELRKIPTSIDYKYYSEQIRAVQKKATIPLYQKGIVTVSDDLTANANQFKYNDVQKRIIDKLRASNNQTKFSPIEDISGLLMLIGFIIFLLCVGCVVLMYKLRHANKRITEKNEAAKRYFDEKNKTTNVLENLGFYDDNQQLIERVQKLKATQDEVTSTFQLVEYFSQISRLPLDKKLASNIQKIRELLLKMEGLQSTLDRLGDENAQLQIELGKQKQINHEFTGQVEVIKTKKEVEAELKKLKILNAKLHKSTGKAKGKLDGLTKSKSTVEQELETLSKNKVEVEDLLLELGKEKGVLEKLLKEKKGFDSKLKALEVVNKDLIEINESQNDFWINELLVNKSEFMQKLGLFNQGDDNEAAKVFDQIKSSGLPGSIVLYAQTLHDLIEVIEYNNSIERDYYAHAAYTTTCQFPELLERFKKINILEIIKTIETNNSAAAITDLFLENWQKNIQHFFVSSGHWLTFFDNIDKNFSSTLTTFRNRMDSIFQAQGITPHKVTFFKTLPSDENWYKPKTWVLNNVLLKHPGFREKVKKNFDIINSKIKDSVGEINSIDSDTQELVIYVSTWGCDISYMDKAPAIFHTKLATRDKSDKHIAEILYGYE